MKLKLLILFAFLLSFPPFYANYDSEKANAEVFSVTNKGGKEFTLKSYFNFPPGELLKNSVKKSKRVFLYPSGKSCGVKLITDGVLVISTGKALNEKGIPSSPAEKSGILPGDYILSVDGIEIKNSEHFTRVVNLSNKEKLSLSCLRDKKHFKVDISPVSPDGKKKYLGMWVRDSTAGLGTLTYISGDKKSFAALGHSISDEDTGKLMRLSSGELVTSTVVSVKKGSPGSPGELTGVFDEPEKLIGKISGNSQRGIYGEVLSEHIIPETSKPYPAASKSEIRCDKASVLCSPFEGEPKSYEINILKTFSSDKNDGRDMLIEVTDPSLLKLTGGIVQGMSGSPIIQNGKIIGAVTHVFVNDPTRGYGIFIENMLAEAEKVK